MTTPKGKKHDTGKARMSLIPPMAELAVSLALTVGGDLYGDNNWEHVIAESGQRRYIDAAMRHLNAFRAGATRDWDSGLHPLAHAICNLMFILEADLRGMAKLPEDDR